MNPQVTYSPAYTVVPTYECFNRCSYCNFRIDIGKEKTLLIKHFKEKLEHISLHRVIEILILSGEVHPFSEERETWFKKINDICELALSLGFLPHTNVGPLGWSEMIQLKQVNVSMGLMLEQLNSKFMKSVHQHAPSKDPNLRLQQLDWAGKMKIPFTTGLLLGIGETNSDIRESLEAIAIIQRKWSHIQEVILQPHSEGSNQVSKIPNFQPERLPGIIALAKKVLPDNIAIQIPPNLVPDSNFLLECLQAGARDLGGIGPKDEVNPDYPHPTAIGLAEILQSAGWKLKPRLPVYPQYFDWLPNSLQKIVIAKKKSLISESSLFW